jgi:Transposase DDE domain group 1
LFGVHCDISSISDAYKQFSLFADRVSAETMRANQMRLYLSAMAYVLVSGLRRLGLKATELALGQDILRIHWMC